jgi:hypothetical protein
MPGGVASSCRSNDSARRQPKQRRSSQHRMFFRSFAEFAQAVEQASLRANYDPRLKEAFAAIKRQIGSDS